MPLRDPFLSLREQRALRVLPFRRKPPSGAISARNRLLPIQQNPVLISRFPKDRVFSLDPRLAYHFALEEPFRAFVPLAKSPHATLASNKLYGGLSVSRRRQLSSKLSVDESFATLAASGNYLATSLFMLALPHADDWGRLPGEPLAFKLLVCPGFSEGVGEIREALQAIAEAGLWQLYESQGKKYLAYKHDSWFKAQSYIPSAKRQDDSGSDLPPPPDWPPDLSSPPSKAPPRKKTVREKSPKPAAPKNTAKRRKSPQKTKKQQGTPQNAADHRKSPQNASSPSPSPSPSLSPSPTPSLSLRPDLSDLGETAPPLTPQKQRIKYIRDLFEDGGVDKPDAKTVVGFFRHFKGEPRRVTQIIERLAERKELGKGHSYVHGVLKSAAKGEPLFEEGEGSFPPGADAARYLKAKAREEKSARESSRSLPEVSTSGPSSRGAPNTTQTKQEDENV